MKGLTELIEEEKKARPLCHKQKGRKTGDWRRTQIEVQWHKDGRNEIERT